MDAPGPGAATGSDHRQRTGSRKDWAGFEYLRDLLFLSDFRPCISYHLCGMRDVIDQLGIPSSSFIALGTLLLDGYVPSPESQDLIAEDEASTSSTVPWYSYRPGSLRCTFEVPATSSEASKKVSKPKKSGSPAKRKRSDSCQTGNEANSKSGPRSPSSEGPSHVERLARPTLSDIDWLVRNAFLKIEYRAVDSSSPDIPTQKILLRVYALPLDTSGLNARIDQLRLKIRSAKAKITAQRHLFPILCNLRLDRSEWCTGMPSEKATPLLDVIKVSRSVLQCNTSRILKP